jgi:TRAP-type C4-dicarboxylate transport system permease small subunit
LPKEQEELLLLLPLYSTRRQKSMQVIANFLRICCMLAALYCGVKMVAVSLKNGPAEKKFEYGMWLIIFLLLSN